MAKCPDISQITVQRTLAELLKTAKSPSSAAEDIRRICGAGRNSWAAI